MIASLFFLRFYCHAMCIYIGRKARAEKRGSLSIFFFFPFFAEPFYFGSGSIHPIERPFVVYCLVQSYFAFALSSVSHVRVDVRIACIANDVGSLCVRS